MNKGKMSQYENRKNRTKQDKLNLGVIMVNLVVNICFFLKTNNEWTNIAVN